VIADGRGDGQRGSGVAGNHPVKRDGTGAEARPAALLASLAGGGSD